jgi:glycosyltransferase involved in cell wall biosynthesis
MNKTLGDQDKTSPVLPANSLPLRIAIVSRRFWPYSGTTEFAVADLASQIKRLGHTVEILTVRWEKNWPLYFDYDEIPIRRINRSQSHPWGSFRYLRSLTRELNQLEPDGIIVFGLDEEAWAISRAFSGKTPFVIRIDNHFPGAQKEEPELTPRQRFAVNSAQSLLTDSLGTQQRMLAQPGVTNSQIKVAYEGILLDKIGKRQPSLQSAARVAISDAHPVLLIGSNQPLVVCGAPLEGDPGMLNLLDAWPKVIAQFPKAKLWILGDGSKSRDVWTKILEKHLVQSVIMPGSFDDTHEIFQAADLYVHPLKSDESCGFLARALAAGVGSVVTSTQFTQTVIENNVSGLVVHADDARALGDAIILALGNPDLRERLGEQGRLSASKQFDVQDSAKDFLRPFEKQSTHRIPDSSSADRDNL